MVAPGDLGFVTEPSRRDPAETVRHPAIVLKTRDDYIYVMWGSSQPGRHQFVEEIAPGSPDALTLDALPKRTYFYAHNYTWAHVSQFEYRGPCSFDKHLALRALAGF